MGSPAAAGRARGRPVPRGLDLIGAGFTHIVLGLRAPYPDKVASRLVENVITPVRDRL
ncbi:hypothetical protein [Nocardia sp. NPDC004711]